MTTKWGHHGSPVSWASLLPIFSSLRPSVLELRSDTGQTHEWTNRKRSSLHNTPPYEKKISHRHCIGPLRGSSSPLSALSQRGLNPIKPVYDPDRQEGRLNITASAFLTNWVSIPAVLVAGATATQNSPFSSLAVAVTIASTHCACPRRDIQAELAWVAGYVMRQFICPKAVTDPSTNRAECRATALIETNALPLHQTATL